jgi:hypothetical protein
LAGDPPRASADHRYRTCHSEEPPQ